MKYIDAKHLKCELEKRLKNVRDYMNGAGMKYKGPKYYKAQGKESAYDALLSVIDSLQQAQPEVDLDELINDFLLNNSEFLVERDSKAVVQKLARHFFELGYSLRKMNNNESDQKIRWKRN